MLTELELQVLVAMGQGALHGYAIGKDVEERSGGRIDPTTGALYQALRRLAEAGLVEQVDAPAEETDGRRRYFALTEAGRGEAAAELRRLADLVQVGRERDLLPRRA